MVKISQLPTTLKGSGFLPKFRKKTTLTIKGCPVLEDNKIMIEVDGFAEKISLIDCAEDFLGSGECTITFAQSNDEA